MTLRGLEQALGPDGRSRLGGTGFAGGTKRRGEQLRA